MKPWRQGWLIAAGAYPGFCSIKRLEVFLLPLDRMLVHSRSLPRNFVRFPQQIAGTHLYTWVERGTVRVKCLAQEHNTLSPARARTRTARSGVERTNHEATAPPTQWLINSDQIQLFDWLVFGIFKFHLYARRNPCETDNQALLKQSYLLKQWQTLHLHDDSQKCFSYLRHKITTHDQEAQ